MVRLDTPRTMVLGTDVSQNRTREALTLMRTLLLAVLITFAGCSNKQEKATKEADKAQKEATDKSQEAAKAQAEADAKAATAQKEAEATAMKSITDARDGVQKDFDDLDRKAAALHEKVAKATGAKRKNADAAAAEVATRMTAAKASLAKFTGATAATLEAVKTEASSDVAALSKAVDNLEKTVK
jgi:cytochrome P450